MDGKWMGNGWEKLGNRWEIGLLGMKVIMRDVGKQWEKLGTSRERGRRERRGKLGGKMGKNDEG